MPQVAARAERTPSRGFKAGASSASSPRPQLAQLAAALAGSPRTQALVQRRSRLQKAGPCQLSRSGQPVIQLESEVKYKTQTVGYEDENGDIQKEEVGKVADAWIDARDPLVGSAPNGQQPELYKQIGKAFKARFVRGHLLNDNLGGVGEIYNLFPITYSANAEHKNTAEGKLKENTRVELREKSNQDKLAKSGNKKKATEKLVPPFVHYRVTAIAENPENLTENAAADFKCEMVAAHSLLPMGRNEVWTVFSRPGSKVTAVGRRATKKEAKNENLGAFKSQGHGEASSVSTSLRRSKVNGWRGDTGFKFSTKGVSRHVKLARQKKIALKKLAKKIESNPVHDEFYFEAMDRAETILETVHDQSEISTSLQKLDKMLDRWVLQRRKSEYLYRLKKWLITTSLPRSHKEEMLNLAIEKLKPVAEISAVKHESERIDILIRNKVDTLLQKKQPQLDSN